MFLYHSIALKQFYILSFDLKTMYWKILPEIREKRPQGVTISIITCSFFVICTLTLDLIESDTKDIW